MTDNTARLDHVVLWSRDPVASARFYETTVGLLPVRLTDYLKGEAPFPSVRLNDDSLLDLMPLDAAARMTMLPGAADSAGHPVNHICLALIAERFEALRARLQDSSVPVSDYAHGAFGARGHARRSFYFRDPDANVVEVRHYD
ncbi:VOC family protein [Streptomyces sp. enrichment culture]|uniref:VOC family protein n=1 Tax=Streptomyces sp. enrichment culture TaxID=1795815 RepID=UPI003F558437